MFRKRLCQAIVAMVALGTAVFAATPAHAVGEVYGPYLLVPAAADFPLNLCMADPNSSKVNNTVMIVWTCSGNDEQRWYNEVPVVNNDYWTVNAVSGKCLTVQNASTSDNAAILQYSCNNGGNERWVYEAVTNCGCTFFNPLIVNGKQYHVNNIFKIRSVNSGKCITVKNANPFSGQSLLQFNCNSPGFNIWLQYSPF